MLTRVGPYTATVIPAQAGIHNRSIRRISATATSRSPFIVSGYGSRAPLRGPGMTGSECECLRSMCAQIT
jgi:hypothetical protein